MVASRMRYEYAIGASGLLQAMREITALSLLQIVASGVSSSLLSAHRPGELDAGLLQAVSRPGSYFDANAMSQSFFRIIISSEKAQLRLNQFVIC